MKARSFLSVLAVAGALVCSAEPQKIPLDWHPTWKSGTVYEVEINRAKLEKLAGVDSKCGFTVSAVTGNKTVQVPVVHYEGAEKNAVALRFKVPAGTEKLFCMTGAKNFRTADPLKDNNIFAGALDKKNIKKWSIPSSVSVTPGANGLIFKSNTANSRVVKYKVAVPAEAAGMPVKFEIDVKSLSGMTWSNKITILQLDAKGKELSENAIDPRGASHMRPPQELSQIGRAHV